MKRDDYYAPLPCGFFRHPKTKAARAADAKAPEAFLVLLAEAELQHRAGGDFGHVRMAWDDFALCAGLAYEHTARCGGMLDALQLVEWITAVESDEYGFRAILPNMGEWSQRDPTASDRQARYRARRTKEAAEAVAREGLRNGICDASNADKIRVVPTELPRLKYTPDHIRLSALLAELVTARDPKARVAPQSPRWLDAIRLLIDRDGRTVREVEHVIRWAQADPFWQGNVLSAPTLRKQFDKLYAKAGKPPRGLADLDERMGS